MFTPSQIMLLQRTDCYDELAAMALQQIEEMYKTFCVVGQKSTIAVVCGAISANDTGTKEENVAYFESAVDHFTRETEGMLWSQIPYEEAIWRLMARDEAAGLSDQYADPYKNPVLQKFYKPLFTSGYVGIQKFLYNTPQSSGARWEAKLGKNVGITPEWYDKEFNLMVPAK